VDQTAEVDFILIPKASGGIENGIYGLRVWIEDTNAIAEQDNVIIVSGNPGNSDMFSSMMPMIMMLMMMGMIMPMTQQMGEGTEEG
jgi:L-lactate utilization protein LutB